MYGVLFADSKEIELFNNCISSIKSNGIGEEESNELITIYKGLNSIFDNISSDWDGNKGSLNAQKIIIHYQNLESILKIVNIIKELKTRLGQAFVIFDFDESGLIQDIESLQKKNERSARKHATTRTKCSKEKRVRRES
ncbi:MULTISPECIES: hypothetical protein [unclassified Wolbachia]|uniref:hypothetical protein n=1 Tax=unclassified Wolbachia TaxID=2640676 RepID=UPI002227C456|nr:MULTISPECIES: hypothetical protein [unclassified Wolbachia]